METTLETAEQVLMESGFRSRELVIVPLPVLASHNQPGAAQVR